MKKLSKAFNAMEGHWQHVQEDMLHWAGAVAGPVGSVYEGDIFCVAIQYGEGYPFTIPAVTFLTPIFHPSVSITGSVLSPMLVPGLWVPSRTPSAIIGEIEALLLDPSSAEALIKHTCREGGEAPPKTMPNPLAMMLLGSDKFSAEARRWKLSADLVGAGSLRKHVNDSIRMHEVHWAAAIRGMVQRKDSLEAQMLLEVETKPKDVAVTKPKGATQPPADSDLITDDSNHDWQTKKANIMPRGGLLRRRHCPQCSNPIPRNTADTSSAAGPSSRPGKVTVRPNVYAWQIKGECRLSVMSIDPHTHFCSCTNFCFVTFRTSELGPKRPKPPDVLSRAEADSLIEQAEQFGFHQGGTVDRKGGTVDQGGEHVVMQATSADNRELFFRLRNACTMRQHGRSACYLDGGLIGDPDHDWNLHGLNNTWR
jgi:ubiquitin-protein ligase